MILSRPPNFSKAKETILIKHYAIFYHKSQTSKSKKILGMKIILMEQILCLRPSKQIEM